MMHMIRTLRCRSRRQRRVGAPYHLERRLLRVVLFFQSKQVLYSTSLGKIVLAWYQFELITYLTSCIHGERPSLIMFSTLHNRFQSSMDGQVLFGVSYLPRHTRSSRVQPITPVSLGQLLPSNTRANIGPSHGVKSASFRQVTEV